MVAARASRVRRSSTSWGIPFGQERAVFEAEDHSWAFCRRSVTRHPNRSGQPFGTGGCRRGEEIHRCNGITMVAQRGRPSPCWLRIPRRFSHPARHGSLGNIEAQQFQLAVNAGCTPGQFFAIMRKMSSRNFLLTNSLPTRTSCRESHLQYNLNPTRCQRMTVSAWTRINTRFHPGQSRLNITQNNLSGAPNRS